MSTNRDLNYRLYAQKESGFIRTAFQREFERYAVISNGDVEGVKRNMKKIRRNFFEGKGELSDHPVRNVMYHFVVSTAMVSRVCVESGMNHDVAYTLSDIYIRKGDKTTSVEGLIDLLEEMQVDFAKRMRELKKEEIEELNLPGIDFIAGSKRYYKKSKMASYIVGYAKENDNGEIVVDTLGDSGALSYPIIYNRK